MCAQYYVVDTFTPCPFNGAPVAVCLLDKANNSNLTLKQKLSAEFNLSATAFPFPLDTEDLQTAKRFELRWFTSSTEISTWCCGGTLAAAHVLFQNLRNENKEIEFECNFGTIKALLGKHDHITLQCPSVEVFSLNSHKQTLTDKLPTMPDPGGIGKKIADALISSEITVNQLAYAPKLKYLLIALDQATTYEQFMSIQSARDKLLALDPSGEYVHAVIISFHYLTSTNSSVSNFLSLATTPDYVVRVFAPWLDIDEESATGSAQLVAAPFWSAVYCRRNTLRAHQYFQNRGAEFRIEISDDGNTLELCGQALTVVTGHIADRCLQ